MRKINVKTDSCNYDVLIEKGALSNIGEYTAKSLGISRAAVISDTNVASLYSKTVMKSLERYGISSKLFVLEAGEKSKSAQTYLEIINFLAAENFCRGDVVIALGGGVTGDLAGFVASTYLRGVNFIQVPTTFLAAIDSSVGGKTGVNLTQGKNLLGAFYQPRLVVIDPEVFNTLPPSEFLSGLGEGLKYAVLKGGILYKIYKSGIDEQNIEQFIEEAVAYKAEIVKDDEKENGKRRLLNLGHTVGHALEKMSDYKISHGEAVAAGIRVMARSAYAANAFSEKDYGEIIELINKYSFLKPDNVDSEKIKQYILHDKKISADGKINAVIIKKIGECEIVNTSTDSFFEYISRGLNL